MLSKRLKTFNTESSTDLINELMEDFFNTPFTTYEWSFGGKKPLEKRNISSNLPYTNVIETKGDYQYELATPGFDKKDITINLEGNNLTIKGEKTNENSSSEKDFLSKEYHFQKFSRTYNVPENIVLDEIYAKIENGVTTIFLPKEKIGKKESTKRTIDIV